VLFAYDPAVEHGVRMTQLIDELAPHGDVSTASSDSDPTLEHSDDDAS
jgi:hypothetical protein